MHLSLHETNSFFHKKYEKKSGRTAKNKNEYLLVCYFEII